VERRTAATSIEDPPAASLGPETCATAHGGGPLAYGAYLPYDRLRPDDIAAVLGGRGSRGQRTVAPYDEDTTSMGEQIRELAVAAARWTRLLTDRQFYD